MNAEEARRLTNQNEKRQTKIKQYIKWQTESIQKACKNGHRETCFAYGEDMPEVREYFKKLGYKFKPTGYSGGVWQDSENIYW